MTTNQLKHLMVKIKACKRAKRWVREQINEGKSPKEIWESCKVPSYLTWICYCLGMDMEYNRRWLNTPSFSSREISTDKAKTFRKIVPYKEVHKAAITYIKGN